MYCVRTIFAPKKDTLGALKTQKTLNVNVRNVTICITGPAVSDSGGRPPALGFKSSFDGVTGTARFAARIGHLEAKVQSIGSAAASD